MEQLIDEMPASDVLALFVGKFNDFVGEHDDLYEFNQLLQAELAAAKKELSSVAVLKSQLDGYKRQVTEQQEQLTSALEDKERIKALETLLSQEQKVHEKTKREALITSRDKSRAENELTHLRQMNPQRLKKQNERLSGQNESYSLRIGQLEKEAVEYRKQIKDLNADRRVAIDKIKYEQSRILVEGAIGIYHDGLHHIVTWPQHFDMQLEDGSTFKQRPLLYVHQSGVAAMLTLHPDTRELNMAKQPKGGLRPPKDLLHSAAQWLYDVNIIRNGLVQDSDFIVIDK